MPNLSPGLNARFASIELDAQGPTRRSRKQYPASLYPENHGTSTKTTPSKAPRLSTAARAETRSSSNTKANTSGLVSQKRNLHLAQGKDERHQDASRPDEKIAKYQDPSSLSFMRETSSSRKKQSSSVPHDRITQTRSSSHSDIYSRRSHHYSVLATKKRQTPQNSQAPRASEVSGSSSEYLSKVPFADKPTIFTSYSPSRNVSAGHAPRSTEDVYTRLYPGSKKGKQTLEKPERPDFSSHSVKSSVKTRTPSKSASPPASAMKPHSLSEIYQLIYDADPAFFTASNSLDPALEPQQPLLAADLISSDRGRQLSVYERGEIMRNANVYYVPASWQKHASGNDINISNFKNNYGFDDSDGNYLVQPKDHIEYRYEIVRVLGTGSFGNVVHCCDHKYKGNGKFRNVAVKLIKNELDWSLQAVSEIKMLKHLMAASQGRVNDHIMNYCDHFHFRGHMCIVSEVLSLNLYTFLEIGKFRGVALSLVKNFAYKILRGLQFVHAQKVIHCDIKPENIMIRLPSDYQPGSSDVSGFDVKLIDFGSSCFESETSFSYIQSRFYRAPEVILGAKYSYEIDMWSFGCVVAELFTGTPLLPGKTEIEQIALILELFGAPASSFILAERKRLLRYMKLDTHRKLNDPLVSDAAVFSGKPSIQVDEKKLKKTLLYTLFNLEGKINLPFLNSQLQAAEPKDNSSGLAPAAFKRHVKISARSLDVTMRLHSSNEGKADQANFSKFMSSLFHWNPASRPTATQLLASPFFSEIVSPDTVSSIS